MTVSVVVPVGIGGCPWRQRAWDYVRARYEQLHPDWELVEGHCDGPWSKGLAVHEAVYLARGDVLVLADADSYTDADVLIEAVGQIGSEHEWVTPHHMVLRMGIAGAKRIYRGDSVHRGFCIRQPYPGLPGGGITVLSRSAYETVGGIDHRFYGWGGEDLSFGWALTTLVGPGGRLQGDLWHLWHPHPAPNHRGSAESEELVDRYRAALNEPDRMLALIEEARHDRVCDHV